jgi:hypothetical protein
MACSGGLGLAACVTLRRGWRWIPLVMTAGALWAIVPDMPRLFRVDFPSLGLASTLGSMNLERTLHLWGDVFFFHHALDLQPKEYALLGVAGMFFCFTASIIGLMILERRQYHLAQKYLRYRQAHQSSKLRQHLRELTAHLQEEQSENPESQEHRTGRMNPVRSSHLSRSA